MSLRPYAPPDVMQASPAILANCFDPDNRVSGVVADELAGGCSAAQLLIDHGHREIVMLAGTPDVEATHLRVAGFQQAMTRAGLPITEPLTAGWEIDKGYRAAMHVLNGPDRPTGVICANDRMAVGVVLAAGRLGLSVPRDLSVVGYDDDENVAPTMVPALSTVGVAHQAIGEQAMRLLLGQLEGESGHEKASRILVPCPLVIRDSVAQPPQ